MYFFKNPCYPDNLLIELFFPGRNQKPNIIESNKDNRILTPLRAPKNLIIRINAVIVNDDIAPIVLKALISLSRFSTNFSTNLIIKNKRVAAMALKTNNVTIRSSQNGTS